MPDLFEPLTLGRLTLRNRILFAPCTRHRANLDETAAPIMRRYYEQRASAGLIISEGINPSPLGRGYYYVPALNTTEQQKSWEPITSAVEGLGGAVFAQLMHVGRLSFPELLDGQQPVGPSAVQPDPDFRGYTWSCPRPKRPYPVPRAMTLAEVRTEITRFADAAERAVAAGFAGIEVHAASGYLPMQFLSSNTNQRTDEYGGSIEGRTRFLTDVVDEISARIGADRVAVKLSPSFTFNDVRDDDPIRLYSHVVRELSERSLAYLQVSDLHPFYGYEHEVDWYGLVRRLYQGALVVNGGITFDDAQRMLRDGLADAVAFGSAFIANPDLPERFRVGAALNAPDNSTFYSQGEAGYTDYPTMAEEVPPAVQNGSSSTDFAALHPGT